MDDNLLPLRAPLLPWPASISCAICAIEPRIALRCPRAEDVSDTRAQCFRLIPSTISQGRVIRRRGCKMPIGVCGVESRSMAALSVSPSQLSTSWDLTALRGWLKVLGS